MSVRGVALWATVTVVGATALAGCGDDKPAAKSASPSSSPSTSVYTGGSSTSPTQNPSQEQTPKAPRSTTKPKDPVAPSSIPPVVRDGKTPRPSVSARPESLSGAVQYTDGVSLRVTGIKQGTIKARGPGEIDGPITTFTLRLTNGGARTLDLSAVVVTLVYGDPGQIARPTYTSDEQDFAGKVKPGDTAQAAYSFGVPVSQRDDVVVHVDFDAVHAAAVFSGSTVG